MRASYIPIELILMWAGFAFVLAGLLDFGGMALEFISIGTLLFSCGVIAEERLGGKNE